MSLLPDGKTETIILEEVVHLPGLFNSISHSQIMDKDVNVEPVNHYGLNLSNHDGQFTTAPRSDGIFVLNLALESTEYPEVNNVSWLLVPKTTGHASRHNAEKRILWHRRLAHIGLKALVILLKVIADALKTTRKCDCKSCIRCQWARKPFTPTTSGAIEPQQLVHSDLCGPLETAIRGGHYMPLFIDDNTSHTDEYILKYKSEALEKLNEWKALTERESGKHVKRFRTDGGGVYTFKKFAEYLKSEGIVMETTTPYTPQSNGVVSRTNRTVMEHVWCMLDNSGLSMMYWAFAVSLVVYLKNSTLMWSVVGKTLYAASHGRKPSLKYIRVSRCLAFVHILKEKWKMLDYRATPGVFVRYSIATKQYFVYGPMAKTL